MSVTEIELAVPAISCGHCQASIEGAVRPLPGVEAVTVDLATRQVRLRFDPDAVALQTLVDAIEAEGYEVQGR